MKAIGRRGFAILSLLIGAACTEPSLGATLEQSFAQPPASARPWVYWFFMDGNWSRAGITADLEAMQRARIGGVILMEVNVGVPRGPVDFMSDRWRELFKHAVSECERLGLEMTLNAGPGWTGSGGPWVAPEQSMQHLVAAETNVIGPQHFDAVLPRPTPRAPFFGEGALPPDLEKARKEFFRDVFVLAFPTPKQGATIADIEEKALYVRAPYSSQPGVRPFFPAPAEYPETPADQCISTNRILDLTQRLSADGRLVWDVPEGRWTVLRFARTATGQNTRPAPHPGLGLESDKFDQAALEAHFDSFIRPLLETLGPRQKSGAGWTMLHIDSWEMSAQNWTPKFREEFERRRGYDLVRFLPSLTGRIVENLATSERFLWDLRQTAQELVVENHALHLKALGRKHGFGLSIEPYDMNPSADMTLGGAADVPMCEFWSKGHGFQTEFTCFEAVSIAHTMGRPIVAAESFTSDDSERWTLHPGAMKAQGDWALSAGINRIVFHRYQHQPNLDHRPGMTMGPYGVHWERTQTWWDMVPAFHEYLARCQFLLRRGLAVADICYLVAEGAPHVFRPPPSATRGDPPERLGYNFDACAPDALLTRMSVKDGKLVLPDGMTYRVLVLPERETMTPVLLRKVQDLVRAGATVLGPPPLKSPSLSGYPKCDQDVQDLAREIWGECDGLTVRSRSYGKGRVVWERDPATGSPSDGAAEADASLAWPQYRPFQAVARLLNSIGIAQDFESDGPVRYTHRREGGVEIYFVANHEPRAVDVNCTFRVTGKLPELWDPLTGEVRNLPTFHSADGRTRVLMHFEAVQSFFVVFRKASEYNTDKPGDGQNFPRLTQTAELPGPWQVSFDPKWGGPETVTFERLGDWTERAESGIRYYSGKATYRKSFNLPAAWRMPVERTGRFFLDLGAVKEVAQVRLNGQDLGVVWCAPWRVEISRAMKEEKNELEIVVANLWPNRLIRDQSLPAEQRLTSTTWNPFSKDSPLKESGLLGPVTLQARAVPDEAVLP